MNDTTSQAQSFGQEPFQAASVAAALAPAALPCNHDFIDLDDPACVRRWTASFGVSEEDLRIAVRIAGPHTWAVAAHFNLE
ncbi:DUF3606 domain-containing protein [Pseudoxanthomonas koreensis]|uniref:DUF3606 domain-containing protein n=1 Tax=Pseudoxanthomonas koreensis TaxID=266061 RepID=UPI0035A6D2E4